MLDTFGAGAAGRACGFVACPPSLPPSPAGRKEEEEVGKHACMNRPAAPRLATDREVGQFLPFV